MLTTDSAASVTNGSKGYMLRRRNGLIKNKNPLLMVMRTTELRK
jgi:hypothetical protein